MMRNLVERTAPDHDFSRMKKSLGAIEKGLALAFDRPRILVADDDPLTKEVIETMGDEKEYRVVSVKDGREAFRLLKRDSNFSAAIFNLTMPHLCGVDLVSYMKTEKRLIRIPVIIVSGDGGINNVADTFAAGALAFLAKPFAATQLQRVLRLALSTQAPREELSAAA